MTVDIANPDAPRSERPQGAPDRPKNRVSLEILV